MSITIAIKRDLDDQFVSDVLITAFDGVGACWYWAQPEGADWLSVEQTNNQFGEFPVWKSVSVNDYVDVMTEVRGVVRRESGSAYVVDASVIQRGIQTILDHEVITPYIKQYVVTAVLEGDAGFDATAADCIVQVGLFGEIVYG